MSDPTASQGSNPASARRNPRGAPVFEPWQDPNAIPYVSVQGVTKRFGDVVAVDDVSVDIHQQEFFALLGGSGSGKTTLLRMLAGFEHPTRGRILIDGQDMTNVPPYKRPVNMMFQSYALFPHMSVASNIAFGLKQDGLPKAEVKHRVDEALSLVQLDGYGKRKPHELSGGQRQRVALARSLVKQPKLLLLDEPLGALDKKLREKTQFELVNIQERVGITFVIVTHDQEEAMTMATRIAVMDSGWITQIGTPNEIYEYPRSRQVAEFIGSITLFEGNVIDRNGSHAVVRSEEAGTDLFIDHGIELPLGAPVWVAIRPEKMQLSKDTPADTARNAVWGQVDEIAYLGDVSIYEVLLDTGKRVSVTQPNITRRAELPITWEDRVWISWSPRAGVLLPE